MWLQKESSIFNPAQNVFFGTAKVSATNVRLISIATPRSSKSTTFGLAFCLRCSFELRRGWDEHAACLMRLRKDFSSAVSAIPGKLMGGHTHICTHTHSYPATALTHTSQLIHGNSIWVLSIIMNTSPLYQIHYIHRHEWSIYINIWLRHDFGA